MNFQLMNLTENLLNQELDFIIPIKKLWSKLSLLGKAESLSYEDFAQMLHEDDRFEILEDSDSDTDDLFGESKADLEELGYYFGPRVMLKSRRPTRGEIGQILIQKTEQIFENVRSIEIFSKYSYSWYLYMNWTLENQGLIPGAAGGDYYIAPDHDNNRILIDFFSNNLDGYPTINLSIIEILAQIGPGWIA